MEGNNSTIVAQSAKEMDQMLKGVMPDTWMGHARLSVEQYDLSETDQTDALAYTEELVEEHGYPSERVLDTVIDKMNIQ